MCVRVGCGIVDYFPLCTSEWGKGQLLLLIILEDHSLSV